MRRILQLLVLALLATRLAGFAQTPPPSPPVPAPAAPRQVLVMLQLPKAHYRPSSNYAGSYGDGVGLRARTRVAEALAREHMLLLESEWPMPLAGVDCFVMRLPGGDARSPAQVAQAINADKRVAWAQAESLFRGEAAQDKALYPTQPAARQWHLADLHTIATGRGTRVAVIDSGVATQHPDLLGQVVLNENFVDGSPLQAESHGTAVAGIIAARTDTRQGIAGVAPHASLLALRACWQDAAQTLCTGMSLAKALNEAILQQAQVINMSLGGPEDRLLSQLIDEALARGITVVAALGGTGEHFPADHVGVLAVASRPPLPYSAVLAPGRDIPSPAPNGGWTLVSGSSFASAHATGLVALLRELGGGQPRDLRAELVLEPSGRRYLRNASAPHHGLGPEPSASRMNLPSGTLCLARRRSSGLRCAARSSYRPQCG